MLPLPFPSVRRLGVARGRGAPVLVRACVLVLVSLGFRVSSVGVVVEQMPMVFVGIMVSQSMLLLVEGVANSGERLVESKLLERFGSDVASWRGNGEELLLECGGVVYCRSAEDGGGFGRLLKGGVAPAPDPALKRLGGLLRPMFFIGLDPVLRGWWLSRLANASWLGVSSTSRCGPTAGALLLRRRRKFWVLDSCGEGGMQQYTRLYHTSFMLLVCVPSLYPYYYYEYK